MKQVVYHPNLLETKEVAIQRLVLIVPVVEQVHNKQAAKDKPGAYISHYAELRTDEQPRARSTAPSAQSLPSTTRPAGSGALRRAGLFTRLVNLSKILCLIPFSLCDDYDASKTKDVMNDLPLYISLSRLNESQPLITFLSQRTAMEPLHTSLSHLAKMELQQTEELLN